MPPPRSRRQPARRRLPPSPAARQLAGAAAAAGLRVVTLDPGEDGEEVAMHRPDGHWVASYRPRTSLLRTATSAGKCTWRAALQAALRLAGLTTGS